MAIMSVEEWRKKKEKEKQGTNKSSATSSQSSSQTKSSGESSKLMSVSEWREKKQATKSVEGWAKSAAALLKETDQYFSTWRSSKDEDGAYSALKKRRSSLLAQADSWRKQYAGSEEAISYINSVVSALSKVGNSAKDYFDYYSQWDSEDEYKDALASQKDYEEKSNFDLDAGQKEIDDLESVREEFETLDDWYREYTATTIVPDTTDPVINRNIARYEELTKLYGSYSDYDAMVSGKKQYLNQSKHIQEGISFSGVIDNADFDTSSGYSSTINENASWWGNAVGDTQYEWINNQNGFRDEYESQARDLHMKAGLTLDSYESIYLERGYDYMTEDEVAIYNYYYAKDGKEKANEYLDNIQEALNYRKATSMYSAMEDATLLELAFGVSAGLDQFKSGVSALLNTKDDYIPASATQMASGMVREDLADDGLNFWYNFKDKKWQGTVLGSSLGQVAYDAITTTANMAPSVLTSMAVGMLNPAAGAIAGNTLMFASSAGNAYQEALNLGYDKSQARAYSTLVGASEVGLQYLLGGISALSGGNEGIFQSLIGKILPHVDNAIGRAALQITGNMLDEGFEEGLQEILTPWFKNLTLCANENINWSEVAYSSLLGAMTAGFMEGPGTISGEVKTYKTGKKLQAAGISAQRLAGIGRAFSADTVAYQLAGKVNEDTGAYTMGRLFNEIGATLTEQNVNDITQALMAKNMPESMARANAEALAYVVEGGQLTALQVAVIEANKTLAEVARTVLIDANTTWNQRSKGYNEALMALAQEKVAAKASRTNPAQQSEENAPAADTVDTQEENGAESLSEADTSPAKVKSISSIQNSQVTIKLEDGSEVNAREADLDPDDGVRIETIASIDGISTEDANFILNTLRTSTNASAQMDSLGAKEAYKYGFYGYSLDHIAKHGVFANTLTETQRQAIYETGRNARAKQVAAEQAAVSGNRKVQEQINEQRPAAKSEEMKTLGRIPEAIDEYEKTGTVNDFIAAAIANDEFSRAQLEKATGIEITGTVSEQKNAVRSAVEALVSKQQEKEQREVIPAAKRATVGKVYFDVGGNVVAFREGQYRKLTAKQSAGVKAAKVLRKLGIGGDIYFFESYINSEGQRVYKDKNGKEVKAPNGWYAGDGSIHIDLNAGNKGEGYVLYTLAHELTHFIEEWSSQKYQVLADFLIENYEKGQSMDKLVRAKQARLSALRGKEVSYPEAYSEVIADSMEAMLADGNVLDKLVELKAKDDDLFMKMKQFFDNLLKKIRSAYNGQTPDSYEGNEVLKMTEENIERLQQLFAEALVDASENYQSSLTPGEESIMVNENGDPVAYSTEDSSVLLSMRTYEEDGRKAFRAYLEKCVSSNKLTKAEMQEMMDGIEDIYQTCREFKDKYAPFSSWSDAAVVRDTYGKPVFSVVTPNGDYKMNLDFSLVCKKRRTLDAVFNEMSKRGIIDDFELGQKSVVKINEIIRKHGLETACALCFVDARRFRQASMADSFTRLYNELVLSLVPEEQRANIDHFNFSGYETIKKVGDGIHTWDASKLDFSHLDEVMKNYGKGTVEHNAAKYIKTHAEGRKLLLRGDFMSSQGFDAVKTQNQDILKLYNSKKGTGGPKAAFGDVQYMNEIVKKARTWTPAKAYSVGGIRIQSFSDYVPRMVFDYAQMIYDLAATKLPAHAYTKEALFVKQFGLTGVKINMSLIPAIAEGGIAPGLDANGDYVWAGESFDYETAKEIQNAEGYTENCGTICVGVSHDHIVKLLRDPNIRMVIPYHKSGLNPIVAHMNKIAEFTDYTNDQRTKGKDGKALAKDFDFSKALHDMGENASAKAVADQYLKWCVANGYTPRFAEFAQEDNYYKLLEDFTLYDKDGNYVPQREVRAVFPKEGSAFGSMKDLIQEGLEEDAVVEGKRDSSLSSIVDEIQKTLPRTEAEISEEQVEQADRDLEAEVKHSDRDFTYQELTAKSNLKGSIIKASRTVKLTSDGSIDKAWVVSEVLSQCESIQTKSPTPTYFVNVPDIGKNVELTGDGIRHGFIKSKAKNGKPVPSRSLVNARAALDLPQILRNSIEVNRSDRGDNAEVEFSHILVGVTAMEAPDGSVEYYAVRTVVESRRNQGAILTEANVIGKLHAINAKKIGKPHAQGGTNGTTTLTHSSLFGYSVADLLNDVKDEFNDTFSNDVYKHLGMTREDNDFSKYLKFFDRDAESVSNRSLLANALESAVQNDIERNKIQEYKSKIDLINAEEQKLRKLNEQIKELSFAKGPRDKEKLRALRDEATKTANRINVYDKQLLRLEASKPLQDVLDREKKKAYKRAEQKGKEALAEYKQKSEAAQRQIVERYQDARKRNVENRKKTAMRHKIQNVVGELNNLLLSNDKKHHVPENLKKAVADALALVNMDTVGAEERAAKYAALIAKETDPDKIDAYQVTMENILRQGEKIGQRLKELRDAYEEISGSNDPDIANAYDPVIAGSLNELASSIGNTSLRDMTIEQLQDVYDMYRMVLTRVRDANKSFLNDRNEAISDLASKVVGEVRGIGGVHKERAAILDSVRKFDWDNLKPVYAFERIGSATLAKVFNKVRAGEDVWAKDVTEAREYYLEKSKKYGYDSWDFKKKYRFESTSGMEFELTLDQILSLYAYSKRKQAHNHLRFGGFVFDSDIETYEEKGSKLIKYKVNTADAHQITTETLADIIGTLSKEQAAFVDEMQDYLSTVMGAKGNEVTMKMYGVKLFKEKFYFPLKSAKQFMFEQNEVSGEVKIKNSGFTNKVVVKANNPVILNNFMDVWAGHVNDMSMYHAFVLPLEDFNRIFNYNSPKKEGQPSVSVKGAIQSAYSPAAVNYVKSLITDLNGGARTDSTTGFINKMIGLFKKGSVFASLSVVIQQPSAIARAAALVDTKYFIGPKVDHKKHKALWDEVKQYAPVAIIKEMGYFDTNMGKSTQDFIMAKEYSGIKEKMKALVTDSGYRDEILSKAPALADEIAWCSIWEAVKRETKAKNPGMDVKSEAFLKKAGERFTEVITKTQVYDSVLARSANMRSKDTGMKMATAFMAEQTTSINMVADALLQGKRGNKKYCRTAIGAVIASQILNSILVSFVYAGRDDDEDKTYLEKYIGTLSGEILDSLNPAGYIPFIKDIMSIVQGYDVERSDMAVVSDLWNAWQNLSKDNVSVYRKVEGFAGSVAQIFGLPVKNIMRDARGIYQTIMSFMNGQQTTKAGIGYAIQSAVTGKDVSNQNQLYEAYLSGDQTQIARVEGRFKDQSAINSAIRKALRENDSRIHEAAVARFSGNLDEYLRLAKEIIREGHFSQDNVVAAINAEINAMSSGESTSSTAQKASGMFKAEDFAVAISQGDSAMANAIKTDIIQTAQKNGKTSEEAKDSFISSAISSLKELYVAGELSKSKSINALVTYCGKTEEKAASKVQYWEFSKRYDSELTETAVNKYYEYAEPAGISVAVFEEYWLQKSSCASDYDKNGNAISGSEKAKILAVIDSLNLTVAQKDALYLAEGWAESKLYEAPWH